MSKDPYNSSPTADLDYIISEIVHCDDTFCPDLRDLHMDGLFMMMELKFPEIQQNLQKCTQDGRPQDECAPICMDGLERTNPIFQQTIERYRQSQNQDPLQNYDGIKYGSPFWFEGAGEVWRRMAHGSRRTTVRSCEKIRTQAEQCLSDPNKSNDYCYRLYTSSLMCVPGVHCPYTRYPFLRCLQNVGTSNYDQASECIRNVPNYDACMKGFVPPDPNIKSLQVEPGSII